MRHALIDDRGADLRQTVDIRLPRAEVSALDGVVEEPIDAVAVVLIILGCIDSPLCGDRVGAACTILITETFDIESLLAKRCRS